MSWSHLTLVTDADLGAIEPEATHSDQPWGAVTWPAQRSEAARELKVWLEADYAQIPGVTDRIRDRWPADYVWQYTASAYTDLTTALRDDTAEDVTLSSVFATYSTDALYVGAAFEFSGLYARLLDSLNANTATLTVAYWGPTGWTSLTISDGTSASSKTCAQTGRITWALPKDWERRDLNATGKDLFWVKLTVSAALTSGTAITQLLPLRAPDGLKRVTTYLALAFIYRGLAAQAAVPTDWREQADKYYGKAETLYARLREHGGIPIDLNEDGVVTPPVETATTVSAGLRVFRG